MIDSNLNSRCSCGSAGFNVQGKPLLRAYCHCTICQAFNQAPYADITLFKPRDVIKPKEGMLELKSYKSPAVLQRGKCVSCGGAVIEYLQAPMVQLVIVPTKNIHDKSYVPAPSLHIFYHSRVLDIQDSLPKYSGYIKSQLAFGHALFSSLICLGNKGQ